MVQPTSKVIGKHVEFLSNFWHKQLPKYYPKNGTVGVVIDVGPSNQLCNIFVQWPEGSTLGDDKSFCRGTDLKLVD